MRYILLIVVVTVLTHCTQKAQKPNIILIMADDLGYETLGCNGGLEYLTPNLDKMAAGGTRFTNFHSTPLCTPSRVQIMTGKYNNRNYIGFGLLDPDLKTFGHYLKEVGYKTAVVGKWQLFGNDHQQKLAGGKSGSLPPDAGFDEWCLWQVQERGARYRDARLEINGKVTEFPMEYGPDLFLNFIEDFIETNRDSSFFIYYPMVLVHDPFEPAPGDEDYDHFERPMNDTTRFAGMMGYMDHIVGRIIKKTKEIDILDNTVIIFLGDNGTDRDVITLHETGQIRGRKGHTVKYGTHVPFIAYGAGVEAGVYDGLADLTDILPTLLEFGQSAAPEDLDGHSLVSAFGGDTNSVRDWIYCYYNPNWGNFKSREYVFDKRYKLYSDGRMFDYQTDLDEEYPLSLNDTRTQSEREKLKKVLNDMAQKKPAL